MKLNYPDYLAYSRSRTQFLSDQRAAEDRARVREYINRDKERVRQTDLMFSGLTLVAAYYFFKCIWLVIKWTAIGIFYLLLLIAKGIKALFAPKRGRRYKRSFQEEYEEFGDFSSSTSSSIVKYTGQGGGI